MNMQRLFGSNVSIWLLSLVLACIAILPALLDGELLLAAAVVIGVVAGIYLFSNPLYALILFMVLIPFEEVIVLPFLGTITRIAGIAFFATYLFHRRFRVDFRALPLVGWLWFFWIIASLSWSQEPQFAGLFQTTQLILMAFLVADYVARRPETMRIILYWYTASAAIVAMLGISNFLRGVDTAGFSQETRTSGFEGQGVEHFAFYLITGLFTSIYHAFNAKRVSIRLLFIALAGLFVIAILASGTRGSWLAVTGGLLLAYLPRLRFQQWATLVVIVAISAVLLLQVPAVGEFVGFRASNAVDSGGAGRVNIWLVSTAVFVDNPILGVGFRNYSLVVDLRDFEEANFNIVYDDRFRPQVLHNIYLQNLLEHGIIGFIFWMVWLARLVLTPGKGKDWLWVYGILMAMLVGGMTNPELNRKYFWLAIGLSEGLRYAWLKRNQLGYNPSIQKVPQHLEPLTVKG